MDNERKLARIERFLGEKLENSGAEGYVLGLSGGMDSAAAAKTVSKTLGPEKLVCWSMPAEPTEPDNLRDAEDLADRLGASFREVDISDTVESFTENLSFEIGKKTRGNLTARTRMAYSYVEANRNNLLVLGADNRSEIMLGYFTKYGDGAVDVAPFADLYKTELRDFASYIGLDRKFLEKEPTAGLWEGQTDEDELGASYEVIDPVLECIVDEEMDVIETSEETGTRLEKVRELRHMVVKSRHKRKRPPSPDLR